MVILKNSGDIANLWFDMGGGGAGPHECIHKAVMECNPKIISNNRLGSFQGDTEIAAPTWPSGRQRNEPRMIQSACFLWLFSLAGLLALAEAPLVAASPPWFTRSWQSDVGLPDNTVVGTAQTPDGFLWLATPAGLARFDGMRFRPFEPALASGVPSGNIEAILADRRGRLWVTKERGSLLCVDQGRTTVVVAPAEGEPDLRTFTLVEDAAGAVWVTYYGGKVLRIEDGTVRAFTADDGLTATGSCYLSVDQRGQLWFYKGFEEGVFRAGRFCVLATFKTQCLTGARAGGIWYCEGKQLWKFSEGSAPVKVGELPARGLWLAPTVVHEDRAGRLWIGTKQEGLFCYDGTAFERVTTSHQDILGLTEDREGNLWVGTRGGGLNQVKPRAVGLLTPDTMTPFAGVCSTCRDTSGRLWAVAKNGSVAWSVGGVWTPMSNKDWGKDIYVQCVAADPQGGVWIGTKANAAQLWRDGTFIANLGTTDGFGGDAVGTLALLTTPSGDVWSGTRTFDGKHLALLHRLAGGETRTFELPVAGGPVVTLAVDAAGDCWAATAKGSLLRVRQDDLTYETGRTLFGAPPIRCLCATPDGSLWIGYGGQGLGRLTSSGFSHYRMEQGLPDDYLSNILADGRGRLWFAGNRGIFSVRAEEFGALAAGRMSRVGAVLYGQNDGLLRLQASHDYWPGALRDDEGKLWFAMESGLAVVNVPGLPPPPDPPPVVIEGVTVNGRTVAAYGVGEVLAGAASAAPLELWRGVAHLRLAAGSKQLEIAFTALGFTKPESIGFKYRLHPLDKDWVEAGLRRVASYPQLPPGDYQFEVIACNGDGAWSTTGATLGLKVLPQFWQTWWFRIVAALILLGSGAGAVRHVAIRRMRRQVERAERARALERERSRIAKDIHDDLGASLTEITLLSELAQSGEAPAAEVFSDMRKIAARTRQLTRTLDTTVWAVNPRNDTLDSLVSYTCHHAEEFLHAADIRCRIDVPGQVPEQVLTATVRHEVFLIVKEALHNVVKHSGASEVTLRVTTRAAGLTFVVEDNGRGFTPASVRLGGAGRERNGLSNMCQRAAEIGGSLELHSAPGQGTRIELDIHFDLT